ncbi:hypothetical protein Droror1_Dr00016462, partial [Drosera rotundifolia]
MLVMAVRGQNPVASGGFRHLGRSMKGEGSRVWSDLVGLRRFRGSQIWSLA